MIDTIKECLEQMLDKSFVDKAVPTILFAGIATAFFYLGTVCQSIKYTSETTLQKTKVIEQRIMPGQKITPVWQVSALYVEEPGKEPVLVPMEHEEIMPGTDVAIEKTRFYRRALPKIEISKPCIKIIYSEKH